APAVSDKTPESLQQDSAPLRSSSSSAQTGAPASLSDQRIKAGFDATQTCIAPQGVQQGGSRAQRPASPAGLEGFLKPAKRLVLLGAKRMNAGKVERHSPVLITAFQLLPVCPKALRQKRLGLAAASGSNVEVGEICLDPQPRNPHQTQTPCGGQKLFEKLSG